MTSIQAAVSSSQGPLPSSQDTYVVQPRDTMSRIAAEHGVSLSSLIAANPHIADPNRIYPGERLDIPKADGHSQETAYTVRYGDTLSKIAQSHGVSLADVEAANPQVQNPDVIYPGERVFIPRGNDSAGGKTTAGTPAHAPGSPAPAPSGPATSGPATSGGHRLSDRGLDTIAKFEGFRSTPYNDAAGNATIGYGHLLHSGPVTTADQRQWGMISKEEWLQLLRKDASSAAGAVDRLVKVPLTQNQFDALTSFTFNLGPKALQDSTLLRKLNAGDYSGAANEFGKFVHAGGQVLQGLVDRRAEEAALFRS